MGQDYGFDTFLMERWGGSEPADEKQRRHAAFRALQKKLKDCDIAAPGTIRAWCGITKRSEPGRDKMYQLAFALHLTHEELKQYLIEGLRMPGVQVNDYREIIYYYGLEHKLSMEKCEEMILVFEKHMCRTYVPLQKTHTKRLWSFYDDWRKLDPVHFLKRMCTHAEMFKGYSKTTLDYFIRLKSELLQYIQEDVKKGMEEDLEQLGYRQWLEESGIDDGDDKELIKRFLKNISRRRKMQVNASAKELIRSVRRDCSVVYAEHGRNRDVLRELYAPVVQPGTKNIFYKRASGAAAKSEIPYMSERHISDLLRVSLQKEREIQMAQALAYLRGEPKQDVCPEWICAYLDKLACEGHSDSDTPEKVSGSVTIGEAEEILARQHQLQKKRCLLIQRDDLLPLLLEVSGRKYKKEQELLGQKTDREEAKNRFCRMANTVLADCAMKTVEDYETDPERSKQISQEDKMRKGLELISGVMIEKFNDFPMSDLLVSMGKNIDFFTPEKVGELAGVIMKEPNVIGDLSGYLSGTEKNDAKLESAIDTLTSVTKMVEPEKNDVEILRDIAALRK